MMNPQLRWSALCSRLELSANIDAAFENFASNYNHSDRSYHTLAHIEECLLHFDKVRNAYPNADAIELAIWLYDVIYDTRMQKERFEERLERPDKRWKFRAGDLDDRALWDDYMDAYTDAIEKTSTDDAPWYIVPADKKWARNVCIARILRHHLEKIDPTYPEPDSDVDFDDIVVT